MAAGQAVEVLGGALSVQTEEFARRAYACAFVGPFDAVLRSGRAEEMAAAINDLFRAATERGVHTGRVVGSGSMEDPKMIEDAMAEAVANGCRLLCVHPVTTDLPCIGAERIAEPFFKACAGCGFYSVLNSG